jgi:hypothetical protein
MVQIALPPDTVAPATRWRTGLLVTAPVVLLAARLLTTPWYQEDDDTPDTARVLTEVAASATVNNLGATLTLAGGVLYAAVAVVLGLWVRPAVPRTATAGLLLGALGGFGLAVCADQQLTIGQAAALAQHRTAMVALLDRVYDSPQAGLTYGLLVLGAVGWVLLGTALYRSRVVPRAAAVVAALGGAAVMLTAPGPARSFLAGGAVVSLVGLAWIAARVSATPGAASPPEVRHP